MASTRGRLLVATPVITDEVFARSVVYMISDDAEGAMGLVLTEPADVSVEDLLPGWGEAVADPAVAFLGGPVGTEAAVALGVMGPDPDAPPPLGWSSLGSPAWGGRVGTLQLDGAPPAPGDLRGARVFVGWSGWSPGQLDDELAEEAWTVVDADAADLLTPSPEHLWSTVLRRQRDDRALWATAPADPDLN